MDFGLFTTWNAVYQGDKVPWDPEYQGGKLLEAAAYKQNFKEIEHIEDAGWDYVWFGGGHFSTQGSMDPQSLMLSAVIANHTKNLKIGTSIHRPTLRLPGETPSPRALPHERYAFDNLQPEDPFQVAEQVAIVDQISEGRFIYGAGARTRGSDERREYFFEYLELLKQLWNEDSFTGFEGKYFNYPGFYENYMGIPKPVQKPLPMLLPVDSQESFVPMGEHGYRIAIGAGSSPHNLRGSAVLREDVQAYRNAWMKAGHEGEPSTVVRVPLSSPTPRKRPTVASETSWTSPASITRAVSASAAPTPAAPAPKPPRKSTSSALRQRWSRRSICSRRPLPPTRLCSNATGHHPSPAR